MKLLCVFIKDVFVVDARSLMDAGNNVLLMVSSSPPFFHKLVLAVAALIVTV